MVANKMPEVRRLPVPPKKEPEPDYTRWLDRVEISDMLGVAISTVGDWQRRGILHPKKMLRVDRQGHEQLVYLYDPKEVAKIPRRELKREPTPGEIEARCVDLFVEGKPIPEVVRAVRATFEVVETVYQKWLDYGGSHVVITEAAREELEKHVGPFNTVAELVERLQAALPAKP